MRARGVWWILGIVGLGVALVALMPRLRSGPIPGRPRPTDWSALRPPQDSGGGDQHPPPGAENGTEGSPGGFQVLTPPGGESGGPEWKQIRDLLGGLREGEVQKARGVAKAIATLLTGSPLLQDLALKEILRLDRGEAGFHAGVLAAAVGLVPDPACATKLLNTAKAAKGPDVVLAIVRALGQNRYGMEVPPGTMTISSTFTDNNTPIQEEDVRMGLLALVQACRGRREPVAQTLLNSTVEVLAFCQEHPDVKALLSEMASGDDKAERTVALQALAVGRSESAVEPLAEALQKARSPAEARAASMGLIRLGTHASIGRVLEKLKEPSTPSEIRIGLLDSLLMVNSGPLTPEQEVAACVLECMASDDSRVRDCAIRVAGGVAAKGVASEELFTKLLAMARDAKISERTRVNVMNALRPRAAQREVARAMAEDLLMGPSSGHDLRAACLNYLANQARPDDAEEFIRLLSEWRERPQLASMVGQIDDIIVRTRAMRDRAGQR